MSILPFSDGSWGEAVSTESLRASGSTDVVSPPKRNLKTAALDEAKSFVGIFIYLFVVFVLESKHLQLLINGGSPKLKKKILPFLKILILRYSC